MLNIANVKPGHRVTVKYAAPVDWGRTTDNYFLDMEVTRAMTVSFTAAGADTYDNMMAKQGKVTSGKGTWHAPAKDIGPCVRKHKGNGTLYLAGINHDTVACTYYIGGNPATSEELIAIKSFLKPHQERDRGVDFRVWTVDKLCNATVAI
jgi:hypothetical protein